MIDPIALDGLVRGMAVGGFATTAAALVLTGRPGAAAWIGAAFFATAIGHTLSNCALFVRNAGPLEMVLWALSVAGAGMFWTFAVTLFTDTPRVPPGRLVPPVAALVLGLLAIATGPQSWTPVWLAHNLLALGLVVHALTVIWRGWRGDLVESRRRIRGPVMAAAAGYVLIIAVSDLSGTLGAPIFSAPLLQAFALAILSVAGALVLMRVEPSLLEAGPPQRAAFGKARPEPDGRDAQLVARLARAMDEEEIWRREELTIGSLARHVGAPEHRLRRVINGELGHRNFAAFVNARRIEAARRALTDPAQARKSVSTIAYELGFGSLGPFNRAFKEATGLTPTAWRQGAVGAEGSPEPADPLPI